MDNYTPLVTIALMVVAFYFLIIRPQKKRQQAIQQTLSSLVPGSRVLLGSGVFGTVIAIGERQALLEISPGVELTVLKQAIVRTVTDADEDTLIEDDEVDTVPPTGEPDLGADPQRPAPSAGADSSRLS